MLVGSIVDRDVPTAHPEGDVRSAARLLLQCRCGVLPVVADDNGGARVVGVLRYRDAFTATYDGDEGHGSMPVAAVMRPAMTTCRATDSLGVGLRRLRRSGDDAVPVLDDRGYLVGMLSFPDLVRVPPTTFTERGAAMANERAKNTQEQAQRREHQAGSAAGGARESRGVARRESGMPASPMLGASPFTIMRRFMEDIDRLFVGDAPNVAWAPAVEMVERDGQLVVRADVPGLEKENVNVEVDDGHLVISGERRQEHEERREGVYRSERVYGRFCCAVPLPEGSDSDHASATFKNGVLEITMPVTGRHQPRRLPVQDATSAGGG